MRLPARRVRWSLTPMREALALDATNTIACVHMQLRP